MGGSQSQGSRVTVEHDEVENAFNVVLISENVIDDLRGKGISSGGAVASDKLQAALDDQISYSRKLQNDLKQAHREQKELREHVLKLERSSRQSKPSDSTRAGDTTVGDVEDYWAQRLDQFNKQQEQLLKEGSQQFHDALERVQNTLLKNTCHTACADLEAQVMRCYIDNPKKPLKCKDVAADFIKCAYEYRESLLERNV